MPHADHRGAERSERRVYHFADLELDIAAGRLSRGGIPLPLPRLSWRLLLVLVDAAPRVLSQDELLERVWRGRVVCGETVTQRVKLLRAALGDDASTPRYIGLVRGQGYRLLPEVKLGTRTSPRASQGPMPLLVRRSLPLGGPLLLALVLAMAAGDHLDRGAFPEAARTLLRATQLEPLTRGYRVNLVIAYVAAGQLDAAEAEIGEFAHLFPESGLDLEWENALLKLLRGRFAEALTAAGNLTRREERLALTAMAGIRTGAPGLTQRALDELTAMDSLPALVRRVQAQAFLGDEASVQRSLDDLVRRCASGQLPREIQRWAWSEPALFPIAPELLRRPASQRLQSNRALAMVDS